MKQMKFTSGTPDALNWLFLCLTLLLAGIHLYLGLVAPFVPATSAAQFVIIGLAFLAGFVVYLTSYWSPVLYLLGAVFALYLGVLWLLGGVAYFFIGVATGLAATCFVLLALYLFYREESRSVRT